MEKFSNFFKIEKKAKKKVEKKSKEIYGYHSEE
jgi:hypothetical protein